MTYSQDLIEELKKYFMERFGISISDKKANEYLDKMADLGLLIFNYFELLDKNTKNDGLLYKNPK